jgi:hypothetical protein
VVSTSGIRHSAFAFQVREVLVLSIAMLSARASALRASAARPLRRAFSSQVGDRVRGSLSPLVDGVCFFLMRTR